MQSNPSSIAASSDSSAVSTDSSPIQELTTAGKISKTVAGFFLFVAWLLLFILGMSVKSSDYQTIIVQNGSLDFQNLLLYALTFTPTNTAILASLAGVLGGFASNLAANNQYRHMRAIPVDPKSPEFVSYLYMTENPLVSMLRGFITYLILIAGSYLTSFAAGGESLAGLTASSYFKLAVSVSLLAYLAGYDPSRMKGLIDSVTLTRKDPPSPTQATTVTHTESLQVATTIPPTIANGQSAKSK